jgi:hypothetical protein
MESLLSTRNITAKGWNRLTAERAIHAAIFALLLVGVYAISGWVCYSYIENGILKIGGITLSWGITLLIMYVSFKKLNWGWWG